MQIIQRRNSNLTNFDRNWREYSEGFGYLSNNYWLGNANIYRLTSSKKQVLLIKLIGPRGPIKLRYNTFSIGSVDDFYRLTIGGFEGSNLSE